MTREVGMTKGTVMTAIKEAAREAASVLPEVIA
jgi:hypothetical protein